MTESGKFSQYLNLMRINRPIGIFLLLWPTWWALWLAEGGVPQIKLLLIFTLGVFLMRTAGCVINDIADQKFDLYVARTQNRPLTQNFISIKSAIILAVILLLIAASLLYFLNNLTRMLAVIAVLIAAFYPFSKRFFVLPQIILGIAFAMSVPMAFAATNNYIPWTAWWVFLLVILWTFVYDTFYAMVDQADDEKLSLHSSAIFLGPRTPFITSILQLIILLMLYGLSEFFGLNWIYKIGIVLVLILFLYQQKLIRSNNTENYFKAFMNNNWVGLVVFVSIALSYIF